MIKDKPPLGIPPRWFHDSNRLDELKAVIVRYVNAECEINQEWIEEYNELVKKVGD